MEKEDPLFIAEELIIHRVVDILNILVGESTGKLLLNGSLSNNTISRRIQYMKEDNDQLIEKRNGIWIRLEC